MVWKIYAYFVQESALLTETYREDIAIKARSRLQEPLCISGKSLSYPATKEAEQYFLAAAISSAYTVKILRFLAARAKI